MPNGVTVSGASLKILYDKVCLVATSCVEAQTLGAYRINVPWTAASTTGSVTSTWLVDYSLAASSALTWMTFSGQALTDTVKGWYLGTITNNGFLVRQKTEAAATNGPRPPSSTYSDATVRPALDVTWTSDGVTLSQPDTLRGNGAELRWSKYAGAAPFAGYAVHRSRTKEFTATSATLVATLRDIDRTTYRDTTATPSTTFYYQVVAGGAASNEWAAALPAAGLARKIIQPDSGGGKSTFILKDSARTACENYGTRTTLAVGNFVSGTAWSTRRSLIAFDLREIPTGATVSSAVMALYYDPRSVPSTTVNAHRVTRAWNQGSANGTCKGDGATWYDTAGTTRWTAAGGDFDATVSATVTKAARTTPGWDSFTLTSLVSGWVNGELPKSWGGAQDVVRDHDGRQLLLLHQRELLRDADAPTQARRRLQRRERHDCGTPRLRSRTPGPGASVGGTAVTLGATAADDNRVTKVEFFVDGILKATNSAEPYSTIWNSTTITPGPHSVTAKATDDAGNVTTSAAVPITVRNSSAPATSITAPLGGSTVSGTRTVSANASDDVGVSKVEFFYDDLLFAEDTVAPYSASWNTLDAISTAYDGVHTLTTRAYDADGQVTTSSPVSVTVANRSGPYSASFVYTIVPQAVVEDAEAGGRTTDPTSGGGSGGGGGRGLNTGPKDDTAGSALGAGAESVESAAAAETTTTSTTCTSDATNTTASTGYRVDLDVTNTSSVAWKGGDLRVWYRWFTPEGGVLFEGPASDDFPQTVQPGQTRTIRLTIMPPALCGGTESALYQLRFDLYDEDPSGVRPPTWFALKGNPPIDHPVAVGKELIVAKRLNNALGLERYYHYVGENVGAGLSHIVNVANGNSLLHWTPWSSAGRGLSTVLDLTYNSLEERSDSPIGHNFSLSISSLSRFGLPLDIHPNRADEIAGNANRWATFTDGDGTTHRFEGKLATDGTVYWEEPPGVHLWLRTWSDTDPSRKWALTRPDRVTFFYDVDGYPTGLQDKNGNELRFTLQATPPGEDPGGPKKRITRVTDAAGISGFNGSPTPAPNRSFDVAYYSKAEAKKAQVRGKIKQITDHSGSALKFFYYDDGNLLRITQAGGTNGDGSFLADRSFVFTYTNPPGNAAAITDPALRVNPEPKTPQSTRLFSVRDPLGRETTFTYYAQGTGALRWKLASRTDRSGARTDFSYNLTTRVTTVTAPLARVSKFTYDTDGKVTAIANALNQSTTVAWTPDFHVQKVTQPTGKYTEFAYNANGYLTRQWNELRELTELTYQDLQARGANGLADPRDASGMWKAGRTIPHVSQLVTKTEPKGTATTSPTTDHQWRFTYTTAGNIDLVTDPAGGRTRHEWNADGTMARITDAQGMATPDPLDRITEFLAYDASGLATLSEDATGGRTKVEYDADGLMTSVQDAEHYTAPPAANIRSDSMFFDYDAFHRLGRQSSPKSADDEPGMLIWSAAEYDANDNQIAEVSPHYGFGFTRTGAVSTMAYDVMDRQTVLTNPDKAADPAGERTSYTYDVSRARHQADVTAWHARDPLCERLRDVLRLRPARPDRPADRP